MYARTRVRTPAGTPRTCARMRIYTKVRKWICLCLTTFNYNSTTKSDYNLYVCTVTTGVNTTVVSTGKLNIHLNYCSYA